MKTTSTERHAGSAIGARLGGAACALMGSVAFAQDVAKNNIEEILVTARKLEERLQDVPVPVTVISAQALVDNNQTKLVDFYKLVPGLNLSTDNRGATSVSIRGLSTSTFQTPTVMPVIDDVPFGASTTAAMGWSAVELDPAEVEHVEVLRGPQGALYGAASLGGLIKYEMRKPSTDGLTGHVQVSTNSIENGGIGYGNSAAINVPLSSTLGVRGSAFYRHEGGYVDNVLTGQEDVNDGDMGAGRLSALWEPSENFSLQLSALYQKNETHGSSFVETKAYPGTTTFVGIPLSAFFTLASAPAPVPLGDLQQKYIRDSGGFDRQLQAYTVNMQAKLGGVDLTSVTGYIVNDKDGTFDLSHLPVPFVVPPNISSPPTTGAFGMYGQQWAAWIDDINTEKFSQEVRLSGSAGPRLDWMLAAFYTDEDTHRDGGPSAFNGLTGQNVGLLYMQFDHSIYRETSGFASLTLHVTDTFDIQVGGRMSEYREDFDSYRVGPFRPVAPTPLQRAKDDATTYLITPRWRITPDVMVYARVASGYRPGGSNSQVAPGIGLPTSFSHDTTVNYELGLKGDFFDNTLYLDASVYRVDWQDIQTSYVLAFPPYTVNLGEAVSQGVELSADLKPLQGLTISGWVAYNDATLTETVPLPTGELLGRDGDRLPFTARFSGSLSATQEFPFVGDSTGFVGASVAYQGERESEFTCLQNCAVGLFPRETLPSYTEVGLRAGMRFETWTANLFVNNLLDKRGVLYGGSGTFNTYAYTLSQPRTIGLSFMKHWD